MAKRNYVEERLNESKERKENRAARNRARRKVFNALKERHGEAKALLMIRGKDIDHIKPLSQGGSKTDMSNLRIRNRKENQSDKGTIFRGKKTTRPANPRKD